MTTPRTRKANAPAMDNAPEPQDHKSPAQREAEAIEKVSITWEDLTFDVPADSSTWNYWEILEPLAMNNYASALRGLLGPQQMMKLRMSRPDIKPIDIGRIMDHIVKSIGMDNLGN